MHKKICSSLEIEAPQSRELLPPLPLAAFVPVLLPEEGKKHLHLFCVNC